MRHRIFAGAASILAVAACVAGTGSNGDTSSDEASSAIGTPRSPNAPTMIKPFKWSAGADPNGFRAGWERASDGSLVPLVACRAPFQGSVAGGKLKEGACLIPWGGAENWVYESIETLRVASGQESWTSLTWGQPIPTGAIQNNVGGSETMYVCRAYYQNGMHPGKTHDGGCNISWGGNELSLGTFQLLVTPSLIPMALALSADSSESSALSAIGLSLVASYPSTFSLATYQTSIKNQGPAGGCGNYASMGALEAAYKRMYGLELDLSEEFFAHTSRNRQRAGIWAHTDGEVLAAFTFPEERFARTLVPPSYAPRLRGQCNGNTIGEFYARNWGGPGVASDGVKAFSFYPEQGGFDNDAVVFASDHIPTDARANATYGATKFADITSSKGDSAFLEQVLLNQKEIIIGFPLDEGQSNNGVYESLPNGTPTNNHEVILTGFDHAAQVFFVKNSWGGANTKITQMRYSFVAIWATSLSIVTDLRNPYDAAPVSNLAMGFWQLDGTDRHAYLVVRDSSGSDLASGRASLGEYYLTNSGLPAGTATGSVAGSTLTFQLVTAGGVPSADYVMTIDPVSPDKMSGTTLAGSLVGGTVVSLPVPVTLTRIFPTPNFPATTQTTICK